MQNIGLLIADEIQLVGGEVGPTYEVVVSRTRYVSAQTEIKTRIVACGVSLANARDLGEWMGAPSHAIFNFSPRLVLDGIGQHRNLINFVQCASFGHGHSSSELHHPPLPVTHDRHVKASLSCHRGVLSNQARHYFRFVTSTMPFDSRRYLNTLCGG